MKTIISMVMMLFAFTTIKAQMTTDTLKTATIKVKGISCTMDLPIIKKKLVNQEGIDEVTYTEVKSEAVFFTVKYHTSVTNEKQIRSAIEAAPSCDAPNERPYKVKSFNSRLQ